MKFNCGPTPYERYCTEEARLKDWHPFFALLPRRTGHVCYWLERIERKGWKTRRYNKFGQLIRAWKWEYRAANAS